MVFSKTWGLSFFFFLSLSAYPESLSAYSESLYHWTKNKVQEVFKVEYQDDIVLQSVEFVDEFKDDSFRLGAFMDYEHRHINKIKVLKRPPKQPPLVTKAYLDSTLVHEYTHFFIKKATFDDEDFLEGQDISLHEAIAYFIQNLWLEETLGKNILNFHDDKKDQPEVKNFEAFASTIYFTNKSNFLYNATLYFKEDAPQKLQAILDGAGNPMDD